MEAVGLTAQKLANGKSWFSMTQQDYAQILFNDLGFDRPQRNGLLTRLLKREIKYLDECSKAELSYIIDYLKDEKENKKGTDQ